MWCHFNWRDSFIGSIMASKDVVQDVMALGNLRHDNRVSMPWQTGNAVPAYQAVANRSMESSFRNSAVDLDQIDEDDREYTQLHQRGEYMVSNKAAPFLLRQSLEDREYEEPQIDDNSEYARMRQKFMSSIHDSRQRIKRTVQTKRQDIDYRRQELAEDIERLKGKNSPTSRLRQSPTFEEMSDLSRIESSRSKVSQLVSPIRPRFKSYKKTTPQYTFNTKKYTDYVKQQEYEDVRQVKKKHDYLAYSKKQALKLNREAQELRTLEKLSQKGPDARNRSKFNNDSQRMVLSKISEVDKKAELDSDKIKCGVVNSHNFDASREDGYLDAIRLKMKLIRNMQ